jgi:kynurenine formamidase
MQSRELPAIPVASPWGQDDEIGRLNLITAESRGRAMSGIDPTRTFDLGIDLFVGMPSWSAAGDPSFAIWMTHTPTGTIVDNPMGKPREMNELVGYSGDSIAMYTHCGTHIDTLNHFSRNGMIWNRFTQAENLGSRHWMKCGADRLPPIVARGVMLDVPAVLGIDMLPQGHAISVDEVKAAAERQGTPLREGDVVLVRTGRMQVYPDWNGFMVDSPGISLATAKYLVEEGGAILLGADNLSVEQAPSPDPDNWVPVHCYCFLEVGVPLLEFADLEALSAAQVYEFCFIASALKIKGATGTPVRPLAIAYVPAS